MKTVFIIGAGASKEANLPIGSELKNSIARSLDIRYKSGYQQISGDSTIAESLAMAADPPSHDTNSFLKAAWHIRDAMPQATSIDSFIDSRAGDKQVELCGKLAIVRTILDAEAKSSLFVDFLKQEARIEFERIANTWYQDFFHLLIDSCRATDLSRKLSSIVLIIFNYDRCIEHYLYYAIQNYYRTSKDEATTLLNNLEIYHPYGTVGALPWQNQNDSIAFGASSPHPRLLLQLAGQIKTFTEGTEESASDVKAIRSHMETGDSIVFLGFAFHLLNMKLLLPKADDSAKVLSAQRHIYATAHGISTNNASVIARDLVSRTSISLNNIHIRTDRMCSQLLQEYSLSLSLA